MKDYRVYTQAQEEWRSDVSCHLKIALDWRCSEAWHSSTHFHEIAQIEVILCGPVLCCCGDEVHTLATGSAIYIPVGVTHRFSYPPSESEWVSMRFLQSPDDLIPEPVVLGPDSPGVRLFLQLADLLRMGFESRHPVEPVINAHLAFILQELSNERGCFSTKDHWDVVDKALAYIRLRQGKAITVEEIAAQLGLSANHVSRSFRKRKKVGLKQFIDDSRLRVAKDIIEHTNQTFGEIAELLDFPDVFAFSRFMKRHLGFPPSELRKKTDSSGPLSSGERNHS